MNNDRLNLQPPNKALQIQFEKSLLKTIRKHKIAIDKLTEKQVAEVFKQAHRIGELEAELARHGIPMPE